MTKVIKREHAERARAHESVLSVPEVMRTAPGIAIQGRKIRSLVFSTDLAVICHCDADAVLAVYPFTCQPAITQALVAASQRPVFNGVGGSITQGERCVEAALHSEMSGVAAVVVNTSIPVESISALVEKVAVPVCVTACAADDVVRRQIAAGASIVNVAAGSRPRWWRLCAGNIPTCRSSPRAARPTTPSAPPLRPGPTPSAGRRRPLPIWSAK